jgi:uncharacterized protein YndB with AHSA1/START domain
MAVSYSSTHGQLEEVDGAWRLRFTRKLPHPPEKVWRALTEPDQLSTWFPTTIEGDRATGAALRFSFPNGEAPDFDGTMLACDPPSVLEFQWGPDRLRFEIRPDGDGCVLTLYDILEDQGKAARDAAGWHVCLDALLGYLATGASHRNAHENWQPRNAEYIAQFPPEASTIGPPDHKQAERDQS